MRYKLKYVWTRVGQPVPDDRHFGDWYPTASREEGDPPFRPRHDGTFASYLEADQWAQWKMRYLAEAHERERVRNGMSFHYLVYTVEMD